MAELNLEDYDESDEDESGRRIFGSSNPGMAFYRSVARCCHSSTAMDAFN